MAAVPDISRWAPGDVELLERLVAMGPPSRLLEECQRGDPQWAHVIALACYRAVDTHGSVLGPPHPLSEPPGPPHEPITHYPAGD
jgi:hypothetical protein